MNYLKSLTFVFFLSVCSLGFTQSKVAHIDSQSLISQMPEVKEAQAQIEKLQKTYQTEIEASMKEYQTKLDDEQKNNLRANREPLLEEADWEINKLEDSGGDASAWRTYRQKLRDITKASDIYNVTWPTKP